MKLEFLEDIRVSGFQTNKVDWISRFIITSDLPLRCEKYEFEDCEMFLYTIPEALSKNNIDQNKGRYVELILECSANIDIKIVYTNSVKLLERFLNRISLIGFCKSEIIAHISTSIHHCEIGQSFDVLWTGNLFENSYKCEIDNTQIKSIERIIDKDYEQAVYLFRKALSTDSYEEKVIFLATCLERISQKESEEFQQRSYVCSECGHNGRTQTTEKATRNFIREKLFNNIGTDKDLFDVRHKVAHGGTRSVKFYDSLIDAIGNSISTIASVLGDRFKLDFVNATNLFAKRPFEVYRFTLNDNSEFSMLNGSVGMEITVAIIESAQSSSKEKLHTQYLNTWEKVKKNIDLIPFYFPSVKEK